jgi:hypothetical protein
MKTSCLILSGLLLAGLANAQNFNIAKDQARRAAAQTEERSGGGQPATGQNPNAPQAAPADPVLTATLQNISGLRADFTAISAAEPTTANDQRGSLLNHLSAAAQGTKASASNVRKLATDLINALTGRKKISATAQKLGGSIHALFNGGHLSATQQEALLKDVANILTAAEVPADDVDKVVNDLKTIAAETK